MEYETYEATAAGGAEMMIALFIVGVIFLPIIIVSIVAMWRIFTKAGEAGWKSLIPIYNAWVFLKLGNQAGWWALVALIPLVNIVSAVFMAIAAYNIGLKLQKEGWWVILYILVPFVWMLILAFDKSTWQPRVAGTIADPTAGNAVTPEPVETTVDTDESPSETTPPSQL